MRAFVLGAVVALILAPEVMAADFTVGEAVKDNTGATIGQIVKLSTDASGSPLAVIRVGDNQFAMQQSRLNTAGGAAVIDLTRAQIVDQLHQTNSSTADAADMASGSAGGGAGANGLQGVESQQRSVGIGAVGGGGMATRR